MKINIMFQRLSILFFRYTSKENVNGEAPIFCRLTLNAKRKQFSTRLFIEDRIWNKARQLAVGNSTKAKQTNTSLDLIRNSILDIENRFILKNESYIVDDIYNIYTGKDKEQHSLVELFQTRIETMESMIGIQYTKLTVNKFKEAKNHIYNYLIISYHLKEIELRKLDYRFIKGFEEYLLGTRKLKPITINKIIQRVRQIVFYALKCNYIDKQPFIGYRALKEEKKLVFLTEEEIKGLENYSFKQNRLNQAKDLYLFSVYTGLAYAEAFYLKQEHIVIGFDGKQWIEMIRQKTKRSMNIPLLPQALSLIEKFGNPSDREGFILPRLSNQKMNSYLKEIADIIGINKRLTHHTARKTFASTILLYNDIPIEIVSKLLGHSSISVTQKCYAMVVNKGVSNHMIELEEKLTKKNESPYF